MNKTEKKKQKRKIKNRKENRKENTEKKNKKQKRKIRKENTEKKNKKNRKQKRKRGLTLAPFFLSLCKCTKPSSSAAALQDYILVLKLQSVAYLAVLSTNTNAEVAYRLIIILT
jgi:hypothetical protein